MTIANAPAACRPQADTLFIAGNWREGPTSYERFDPSQLERSTGRFASATDADVRAAYDAAAATQPECATTPAPVRAAMLRPEFNIV